MPCYKPLRAYSTLEKTENGKRNIVFRRPAVFLEELDLPCGQCIGCRLLRSVSWALRCTHEMQLHSANCFITLTYDAEHLPKDRSLQPDHFTLFMKRLRRRLEPKKISYFMCGEYGDESWRPHYHAIIFGFDFPDRIQVQSTDVQNPYYISTLLKMLWPYGNHIIAQANYETAAYVARYCTKKVTGDKAEDHYHRTFMEFDDETGELIEMFESDLIPEYARMSRNPSIGKNWYKKYHKDAHGTDYLVKDGKKLPVPRYYDKLLEQENEFKLKQLKEVRKYNAIEKSLEELHRVELVKKTINKSLKRKKV